MTSFEMIKYHGQEYPSDIPLHTEEIAAHFDVTNVDYELKGALHTEYSYGKRKFNSALIAHYSELLHAQKDNVPQLWKNETWALQFAAFIFDLVGTRPSPSVIEIHPPFSDYANINSFVKAYSVFERIITEKYPNTEILIENRCGSVYRGGKFIISKLHEVKELCDAIDKNGLQLKIAYDIPQLFTAHNAKSEADYMMLLDNTKILCEYIGGVHLWGKRLSDTGRKVSHCGDLNTYFGDSDIKKHFLAAFQDCFDDNVTRKMVLEVNSGNEDLKSIVYDLVSVGICFV